MALLPRAGRACLLLAVAVCLAYAFGRRADAAVKELRVGYYADTCPAAEEIVREAMARALAREPRSVASVMRLQFHDCFVNVRMRRVGADGRDADDAGGEGGALQHQLPALLRGGGPAQGRRGGALPRRRLLRRHHRHGRPRRRLADRWAPLGREARARGQPDGEPGGLGQHHAQPARQRHGAHPPLRRIQPQRHRPRGPLRVPLHWRGPLLLHHVPPLQPVGIRPPRPAHGPGLPRRAPRALPARGRPERHRRHGRHPRRIRQPVLQGPRPPPRLPELRPDALLRQPLHPGHGQEVQRGPGRLLQGLRRGDGQDGRATEPQQGGDTGQLPRRQRLAAASAQEPGRAVPGAGLLIPGRPLRVRLTKALILRGVIHMFDIVLVVSRTVLCLRKAWFQV